MFKFIVSVLCIILTGCGEPKVIEGRMDNIVRVFWHQGIRYSVLVDIGNHISQLRNLPVHIPCGGWEESDEIVSIVSDVAPDNTMWASWKMEDAYEGLCIVKLEIHTHSPKDIGEGAWTCGKSTCQTSVIE